MELVIDRLTKRYQNKIAVDQLSFTMTPGVYGLLGANGAGKTTLMRMICGVLKPTSGEVKWNGLEAGSEPYRDALGYLPQDCGFYPDFTSREFLLYLCSLKGLTKPDARVRTAELLELTGLTAVAGKKIKTFSGGMKQRLGIAQALINNPKILVLDEPTAGLDPKERVRFRNLISGLGRDRIVLLSTHIVSDIEQIADLILVMKAGRIIHSGTQEQLLETIASRVYECVVADEQEAGRLTEKYPVMGVRQHQGQMIVRLAAEKPPVLDAVPVKASLEDLYLYYFNEVSADA